jgi:hypothetical protein
MATGFKNLSKQGEKKKLKNYYQIKSIVQMWWKFSSKFGHSFSENKNIATDYSYLKNFMFWQNYGPKKKMVQIRHICI